MTFDAIIQVITLYKRMTGKDLIAITLSKLDMLNLKQSAYIAQFTVYEDDCFKFKINGVEIKEAK